MDFPFANPRLAPSTLFYHLIPKVFVIDELPTDIDAAKALHRALARSDRDALWSGLGAAAAVGVAARYMMSPKLVARTGIGTVVASYVPVGSEIDPRSLMDRIAARGSRLCLPDVIAPDAPLEFSSWSMTDVLRTGAYGISVPEADAVVVTPDLLLVPMLAFDRRGFRLGYGGGFYDRTIAALRGTKDILTVGLAFSGQVRDDLPTGPHDMRLDWIVTESAALRVSG